MEKPSFTIAAHRQHLAEKKLLGSRCQCCMAIYLPPRPICPACHSRNMDWHELSGEGTIIGLTSIAAVPTAMAARGFSRDRPYLTGIIALKEGPNIAARLHGAGGKEPEIGIIVKADFIEEGKDHILTLFFVPQ